MSEQEIAELYVTQELSAQKIADHLEIPIGRVYATLRELDIPRRNCGPPNPHGFIGPRAHGVWDGVTRTTSLVEIFCGPHSRPRRDWFWGWVGSPDANGCRLWMGGRHFRGYGSVPVSRQTAKKAHRVAYVISTGEDPGEFFVCHRCDNPPCVEPTHLFVGSALANSRDAVHKGRQASRLSPDQVREIRAMYVPGQFGARRMAQKLGIPRGTIRSILLGETWAHLD